MRSQFWLPLLVGMLQSLFLGCAAPAQTVEIQFDRFRNYTTVAYPPIDQQVARANKRLTPTWLASFDGQTPIMTPRTLSLAFVQTNRTWEYLRCHYVAMLADGFSVQLPSAMHEGSVERDYVIELINVRVSFPIALKLSASELVEFKVCNTE